MPPRALIPTNIGAFNLASLLQSLPTSLSRHPEAFTRCSACFFSTTASNSSKQAKKKIRRRVDPYRNAQALQRKNANIERQRVLGIERKADLGDPIRSKPTPFIESLISTSTTASQSGDLNYFLKIEDAEAQLKHSKWLTEPLEKKDSPNTDAELIAMRKNQHEQEYNNATRAVAAIASLDNGSSQDKTRLNIQRCIEIFGRHNTDKVLPPKPASRGLSSHNFTASEQDIPTTPEQEARAAAAAELALLPKRAGADTGSSEVQIAILTAKINVLADNLGKKDKHNKRNLRLLVHRRQKLLSYLRRKERGGSRWQNLVEKLGISDAMWKGEISL